MRINGVWMGLAAGLGLTAALWAQQAGQPEGPPPNIPGFPASPPPPPPMVAPKLPTNTSGQPSSLPALPQSNDAPNGPNFLPPAGSPSAPPANPTPFFQSSPPPETKVIVEPPSASQGSTAFRMPELGNDNRPGKQESAVSIEWVGPANARFNQPMSYQVLVRNTGPIALNQVVVKPNLPTDVKIKASDPYINPEAIDTGWLLGTLQPGQLRKIEVTILSKKRGYQSYNATVTFASTSVHLTEVREPLLQIKIKSPEKVVAGEPAPILFTLTNPGDGLTENVKVRAVLPEGLEHPRGQAFEIDAGKLAPRESRTLQLACVAKGSGTMKTTLVATAEGNLTATESSELEVLLPRLDVVLNGPKLRFVDRPARYTLKVTNPGTVTSPGVMLNEVVPAGFKFQAASNQGRFDEATRTVSWALGDLPPGQSREIMIDLIPTTPGDHRLAAQVQSSRGTRGDSNMMTRVEGLSNLVLEVSNADNPVEVGADATYEIRVANNGTRAETNVALSCTLPDAVDFRDAKSASASKFRVEGRELVFESIPRLAPRAEIIFRVVVKGRLPGDVRFRARIQADGVTDSLIREETTKFYDDNTVK